MRGDKRLTIEIITGWEKETIKTFKAKCASIGEPMRRILFKLMSKFSQN